MLSVAALGFGARDAAKYTTEGQLYEAAQGTIYAFPPQDVHWSNIKITGIGKEKTGAASPGSLAGS